MRRSEIVLALAVALSLALSIGAALGSGSRAAAAEAVRPAHPSRIVTLSLPADEIVLAIADRARIAGLSPYAGDPLASNVAAQARGLPHVAPRAESILARQPDLVIAPFYLSPETLTLVREARVAVCPIGHAATLDEVRAQIAAIGECVGETSNAARIVREMDARLEATRARVRGRATPSVLLYDASGTTAGRGSLFDQVIAQAGGRNAAARLEGNAPLPLASLLQLDPEYLVVHRYVAESRERALVPQPAFEADARYAALRAVRGGRIVRLPSPLVTTTSHHVATAIEALARAIHPEAYR